MGNADVYTADGLVRRVFDDLVQWLPDSVYGRAAQWDYAVYKFAFVPGFHVCEIHDDGTPDGNDDWEQILSSHRTLAEAMAICKVLLANGGAHYES